MDLFIFFSRFQYIVGLLAFLTFFYYLWRVSITGTRIKTNQNIMNGTNMMAPEAAGAWPIVGHLPQLVGPQPLFKILGDMADKYGSTFMVRFGMHPTLVVSSWEMAKECFTTNDKFLASRPTSAGGKYLTYDFAMFGFSFYGPYWREIRKISTLELLSHRRVELLKHVPYTEIGGSIKQLYKLWMETQNQNKQRDDHQVKVDMSQVFGYLTLNTVLKLVVGKGLFNNNDMNHEQEEGRKLHETVLEFFKLAGVSVASDALPFLGWLDVDGQKRSMKRIAKEMDLIAERWLQEHRQKRLTSNNKASSGHDDFMSVLLSILDDDSNFFNYNRDTVIKATSLNLILAASDTTSVSLTWVLSLLVTNPGALKKVQDELDTKVGRNRHVEERDIEKLVYLQATVKETLRMYPAGPLSVPHEATQDCTVGGYQVTAGTRLVVNVWKLQRDPRVWPNPSEFKPERFLPDGCEVGCGEAANMDFRGQHFEYIPFGSGRRMCPGIDFAIQIIHMTLARLLHAFEFQVPSSLDKHLVPKLISVFSSSFLQRQYSGLEEAGEHNCSLSALDHHLQNQAEVLSLVLEQRCE